MNREKLLWTVVLLLGVAGLVGRAATTGMGSTYVKAERVSAKEGVAWTKYVRVPPKERGTPGVELSWSRTVGVWVAALFTLFTFSFLYGDTFFFKLAQAVVVGVSTGFTAVVGFWTVLVPSLYGKLAPDAARKSFIPGLPAEQPPEWIYLVPLVLSVMLLWRLSPKGAWISRWPLAFIIGLTAGLRMVTIFKSDFVDQIANTIVPLWIATDGQFDPGASLKNLLVLVGVLSSLTYFFFSLEHRGIVGKVSRVGICVLMITFGGSYAMTVMGRISLLAARLQFLFDDWLWLIDPLKQRG